jgi:hypothetical protein
MEARNGGILKADCDGTRVPDGAFGLQRSELLAQRLGRVGVVVHDENPPPGTAGGTFFRDRFLWDVSGSI